MLWNYLVSSSSSYFCDKKNLYCFPAQRTHENMRIQNRFAANYFFPWSALRVMLFLRMPISHVLLSMLNGYINSNVSEDFHLKFVVINVLVLHQQTV